MRSSPRLPTISVVLLCCLTYIPTVDAQATPQSPSNLQPAEQKSSPAEVVIPGPLRSLLRMAGISQKASEEEVVPLLARNIYVQGYEGWKSGGRPTEFLILLARYVNQAKELAEFAGPDGAVHLHSCDDAP